MYRFWERIKARKLWLRLVLGLWALFGIAWIGMTSWTIHVERTLALQEAQSFAESIHQVALAGHTALMEAGTHVQRKLFLEEIRQTNNIDALRFFRGDDVVRQYGMDKQSDEAPDVADHDVLRSGRAAYRIWESPHGEVLRAVLPVIARKNYLGRNCIACHRVAEGTILGAVSMDISLAKLNADMETFRASVFAASVLVSIPLILFIYLFISRSVSRPLNKMVEGLNRFSAGAGTLDERLTVQGADEIAAANSAFNRALEKARQMLNAERIAADVFEHALEGIMVTDRVGRVLKINPAFTKTTGYAHGEVLGNTPSILKSGRHDQAFYESFWSGLLEQGQWQGELWNRRKNGEIYPEWLNISSVRSKHGEIEYFIAIFSDITERKRLEATISHQAYHDHLTGLPNRALFNDRFRQALAAAARDKEKRLALLFLDLDHFKKINDRFGHDAGDALLKQCAERLRWCVRASDTVARLGGDEFVILLPAVDDAEGAAAVARKIVSVLSTPFQLGSKALSVTVSVGISLYPEHGYDIDNLLKHADNAMYSVKEKGRAGYAIHAAG